MYESESEVAQSCATLSNPMDCSLPVSSVHGIFQARVLEWGAIVGLIPRSGKSPGEGNGNPLNVLAWGNPMDKGAWRTTLHWVAKSWTQLSA